MLGDWAWDKADKIIGNNPSAARATLVPIILGSDKTTVSIATGQTDYYLLYLSIGNACNTTCHAHCDVVVLIGFLAMLKMTREHANTQVFHKFKKQLFHSSLAHVLRSLGPAMTVPETVLFNDQYYQCVIYALAAYIADYKEQVLLSCIMHNWCPKCLTHQENLDKDALWHHHKHTELIIRELDPQTLWEGYGIDGDIDIVPFTSGLPCMDIQRMLSLDILHQLIKGGFKDHLVDWVERYLIHIHGKGTAEKILDDIDQRIAAVTLFTGLQHFPQGQHVKQWTGDDSKGLMKVYIAAIKGYVLEDVIHTFCAFLKFCYLICQNVITEPMLTAIKDALACFHLYHEVFWNAQVITMFSLPWQHAMKHYPYLICQFSTLNGLCSLITKSKHIKAVKQPYQHANHFQALRQMLAINQRLDKFAAVHADFEKHGMLRGTCLSYVLGTLEQYCNETHNETDHDVSNNQDCEDSADEPTASFEEDAGDTDDSPMNMRDLATELNIPQLLNILHCFLQSQLQHDNHNPEDVPLDEYPFYDESVCVYNSASLMFHAPSDYLGMEYPCMIICWFDHVGDGPDTNTGMWIVRTCNAQDITIIHIDTIYCAAQLIPIYLQVMKYARIKQSHRAMRLTSGVGSSAGLIGHEELSDGGCRVRNGSDRTSMTHTAARGPSICKATDGVHLTHARDLESQPFEVEVQLSPPLFTVFAAPMVTQFIISFCISLIIWLLQLSVWTVAAIISIPNALLTMDSTLLKHPPTALIFLEKNHPKTTQREERLARSIFGLNLMDYGAGEGGIQAVIYNVEDGWGM
ncbi:hypothetical protein F5J12DRAFT_788021 [Pisolithus orientalis]|uniref:uncharacterized protein n=1 Tax=Pisolithus orientalis TaxID=936130 RepID=UPI00222512B2|nr:uncharacterized protein F5J12DRAFT_788021 [Pisolithus orientalis]KAI5982895.1 hypothetical protein F5J12DRAFT_788021 [Pisolithus orientalis]